jgi:hypothetical protein
VSGRALTFYWKPQTEWTTWWLTNSDAVDVPTRCIRRLRTHQHSIPRQRYAARTGSRAIWIRSPSPSLSTAAAPGGSNGAVAGEAAAAGAHLRHPRNGHRCAPSPPRPLAPPAPLASLLSSIFVSGPGVSIPRNCAAMVSRRQIARMRRSGCWFGLGDYMPLKLLAASRGRIRRLFGSNGDKRGENLWRLWLRSVHWVDFSTNGVALVACGGYMCWTEPELTDLRSVWREFNLLRRHGTSWDLWGRTHAIGVAGLGFDA